MAGKRDNIIAIEHVAAMISHGSLQREYRIMNPKMPNYIRVGETRRSKDERRQQKEIKATLYVNWKPVCDVIHICDATDEQPHGTAIAILWLRFEQAVGRNIVNVDDDDATLGRREGDIAAGERNTRSAGRAE
jgi:hypothetical protein